MSPPPAYSTAPLPHPERTIAHLDFRLERNLLGYVAAAVAAGTNVVTIPPAQAKIVYTPAHVRINPHHVVPLDLNNDGIVDFLFVNQSSTFDGTMAFDRLYVLTTGWGAGVWVRKNRVGQQYAPALPPGVTVGPKGPLKPGLQFMDGGTNTMSGSGCTGPWNGAQNKYLGLKLLIHGEPHFGWARLNVKCNGFRLFGLLTGYAYETRPKVAIVTGKTMAPESSHSAQAIQAQSPIRNGSLGMLAVGRSALTARH